MSTAHKVIFGYRRPGNQGVTLDKLPGSVALSSRLESGLDPRAAKAKMDTPFAL
jgi:hypothetical protein